MRSASSSACLLLASLPAVQPPSTSGRVQTEAIRAFAKTEGYKIAGSFEEHESGKGADALDRRPKLAAAIKAAKKAGGPVIVSKLDRFYG